jgi:hypothetical protein
MNARERFRMADAYQALFSAGALVILLFVLFFSCDSYLRWRSEAYGQMKELAEELVKNLTTALSQASRQLGETDKIASGLPVDSRTHAPIPIAGLGSGKGGLQKLEYYWPVRITWYRPCALYRN